MTTECVVVRSTGDGDCELDGCYYTLKDALEILQFHLCISEDACTTRLVNFQKRPYQQPCVGRIHSEHLKDLLRGMNSEAANEFVRRLPRQSGGWGATLVPPMLVESLLTAPNDGGNLSNGVEHSMSTHEI